MRPGPASLALFFAALILYGSAFAQDEVPPGTIHELRRADLSGAPGMEVITSRIDISLAKASGSTLTTASRPGTSSRER